MRCCEGLDYIRWRCCRGFSASVSKNWKNMTEISSVHKDMKCCLYHRGSDRESCSIQQLNMLSGPMFPSTHSDKVSAGLCVKGLTFVASSRQNIFRLPGQTRQSLRSESNHHLWCALQEQGHISPDHCLIPTISHCPGGSHANPDQTGKENPSYWLRLIMVSSQKGMGLTFP